jgi:hypothetical protein
VLTAVLRTGTGSVAEVAVVHGTGAGMESGRRAGASVVAGVLTGPHSAQRLRSAGATHVLRSVADLPGLVAPLPEASGRSGNVGASAAAGAGRPEVPAARETKETGETARIHSSQLPL